eukprot:364664-Chlamydomonas_euryale.AAC.13
MLHVQHGGGTSRVDTLRDLGAHVVMLKAQRGGALHADKRRGILAMRRACPRPSTAAPCTSTSDAGP